LPDRPLLERVVVLSQAFQDELGSEGGSGSLADGLVARYRSVFTRGARFQLRAYVRATPQAGSDPDQ